MVASDSVVRLRRWIWFGLGSLALASLEPSSIGRLPGGNLKDLRSRSCGIARPTSSGAYRKIFVLDNLADFAQLSPDLIVEAAHPDISRAHAAAFLQSCDYMPVSVTALADDALRERLVATAERSGHRLIIPRGALVGADALHCLAPHVARREHHVSQTPRQHRSCRREMARPGYHARDGDLRRSGAPDRAAVSRNVNTMVTCALATVGLDRCRGRMIADPALDHAVAEVEAMGSDGSYLATTKRQPMVGVSGTEMFASTLRSVLKATGRGPTMDFL